MGIKKYQERRDKLSFREENEQEKFIDESEKEDTEEVLSKEFG